MADNNPFKPKGKFYSYAEWGPKTGTTNPAYVREQSQAEYVDIIRQGTRSDLFPKKLSEIAAKYPDMKLGSMVGLAQADASDDVLAAAARLDTYASNKAASGVQPGSNMVSSGTAGYEYLNSLGKTEETASEKDKQDARWFAGLKGSSRYLTTALYTPIQLITNTARQIDALNATRKGYRGTVTAGEKAGDFSQIFKDTYLYQNLVEGKSMGEGYFWGGEALAETERIAAQIATVNGKAYTPGRAIEGMVGIDPGERGYGLLSGVIDGVMSLGLDPVSWASAAKQIKNIQASREATRTGVQLGKKVANEITAAEDIARAEARATASARTAAAREGYKQTAEEARSTYQQLLADARYQDELITRGMGAVSDQAVLRMREVNGLDDLYKQRDLLFQQVDDLKAGVLVRDAAQSKLLNKSESAKFLRTEINKVNNKINGIVDNIYIKSDPTVSTIIETQKAASLNKLDNLYNALADEKDTKKIATYIEKRRAGLLEHSEGYTVAKEDARKWFSEGNADELFQAIADEDSAYLINKLGKGKFGAEISSELAAAKTIDDVERVLLPRIGIDVLQDVPRSVPARYATKVLNSTVLRSGRTGFAYDRASKAIKKAWDFMPKGRPVALQDTEGLAEETRRWMVSARYDEADIAKVWDEIVTSDPHNFQARQKIVTTMLNKTAQKYADELKISNIGKRELNRLVKAYESELNGFRQYASRQAGSNAGEMIVGEVAVDLKSQAHSITQFAGEIALPDVQRLREYTGRIAKVARWSDNKIFKSKTEVPERVAFATTKFLRSASDGFLRSVLLVFRPAFIIRNLQEMQIRSFLAGGMNIATDPVAMASMVLSTNRSNGKLAEFARANDPYTVDIKGQRFMEQGMDKTFSQEWMDSHARIMQERGYSFDGRAVRTAFNSGDFRLIKLNPDASNSGAYAKAVAHRLLTHRADPIKRAIAGNQLPKQYQRLVTSGKMSFEDAFVQAVRDGIFAEQIDIMRKSSEPLRRLLSTSEGMKTLFFTGENSYKNQMLADSLGNEGWLNFIATNKVTIKKPTTVIDKKTGQSVEVLADETLFELSPDYIRNSKKLTKLIDNELVDETEAFKRGQQLELPFLDSDIIRDNWFTRSSNNFFRLSSFLETKVIYSPEYRVAYWEAVTDLAPLMSKEGATSLLAQAQDIKKTRVAVQNADGSVVYQKWTQRNPAFNDIIEASKRGDGILTLDEIDAYARDKAANRISKLYYDALQKRNVTYAMQLVIPFANAWANTIYKWGQYGSSPTRFGSRIMPSVKLFSTLQSDESAAIYDVLGTKHDPSQGFIHENLYGEKVFTLPFSGYLSTAFGLLGNPRASDITVPVQSMNLLLSGADLPGSDFGLTPGVGNQWNMAYSALPSSIKESIPPVVANMIAPYGDKTGQLLGFAPAWAQKIYKGIMQDSEAMNRFAKPIMAYEVTSNPEFIKLYDGTPLSVEERALLQEKLASGARDQSRWMYIMQGALQAVLPGTPVMEYYAKNQEGQSFFQWQLAKAFNDLLDVHNGNYEMAYQEYATMFGRQALLASVSGKKDTIWATDRAWQFATDNPTAFRAYADVLPYFFAGSDFSSEYRVAMERRKGSKTLSPNEVLAEADKLMISAVKGQLSVYAAVNGLGAEWIDDQMSNYKMDNLDGYEPEVSVSTNKLAQKIIKVEAALKRPEFQQTQAGMAAVKYSEARAAALEQIKLRNGGEKGSLSNKDSADLRFQLEQLGQQLSRNNPDFANLYQRVYLQELRKG